MNKYKKTLNKIGFLYVLIISFVNFLGYLLASTGKLPVKQTSDYLLWQKYMQDHNEILTCISIICFIVPAFICVSYLKFCKDEVVKRRLINIPLVFSIYGVLGWVLSFIVQLVVLVIAKFSVGLGIKDIILTSGLNMFQASLFIFTLGFLIMYTINSKWILPRVFPDENILLIKGIIKPSVQFLFGVFYFSIGLFPIFYFYSTLINMSSYYNFKIESGVYIIIIFLVAGGIIMLFTFANFFSYPLKKLKDGTEKIREGIYDDKIDVVSNDSLGELAYAFNEMADSLDDKTRRIIAIQDSVIRGMAVMVESRDNSTGGHINRTSDCVKIFVEKLRTMPNYKNISENFYESVIKAAPMHDLGKIAVDDAILRKPGRFTDEEYEIMKKHSGEGARIVENVVREVDDEEFKQIAINVAHYHHEKWDGSGYPEKISGQQIPFEARIMALADVFDALVSKRCYKDSFSYDKAFQIIKESLGSHFDPELGEIFLTCRNELETLYNSY